MYLKHLITLSSLFILINCDIITKSKSKLLYDYIFDYITSKNANIYIDLHISCWKQSLIKDIPLKQNAFFKIAKDSEVDNNPTLQHMAYNIIDFDCDYNDNYFLSVLANMKLCGHQGLILCSAKNYDALVELLTSIDVITISNQITIAKLNSEYDIELLLLYRLLKHYDIVFEKYGNWSPIGLQLIQFNKSAYNRRRNLKGLYFRVGNYAVAAKSVQHMEPLRFRTIDSMIKRNYGYISCLIEALNITYSTKWETVYGYLNKTTKKWNGLVDSMIKNTVNLSAFPLAVTYDRLPCVEFYGMAFQKTLMTFVLKRPAVSVLSDIFSIVFHQYVWYTLGIILFVLLISVRIVMHFETRYNKKPKSLFADALIILIETVCQQGFEGDVIILSARILFFVILLMCLLLYTAYSAMIVVLLQSTRTIDSMESLLHSNIGAGAEEIFYNHVYMPDNKGIRKEIYEKKIGSNGFYSLDDGIKKMMAGGFAFHIDSIVFFRLLQDYSEAEVCGLQMLYTNYIPGLQTVYQVTKKGFPFNKFIIITTSRIIEYGLHYRRYIQFSAVPKCGGIAPSFKGIEISDVYRAFYLVIGGIGISFLILIIEIIVNRIKKQGGS